ncbi:MULE domain-containing protein, partial [Aphis craccivora]
LKLIFLIFFGLPFLEPENVIDCFTDDFMAIQPAENNQIVKFTDYIFEYYISPDAMFPPKIWAQFTASVTNSCESFHSKLNMSFYTSHPKIYNFVDVLLQIQSETYIKFIKKKSFIREQMIKHERKEIVLSFAETIVKFTNIIYYISTTIYTRKYYII